jgi:multidrug efflux pump subunit AcrA (membrane-fusion protein)
VRRDRHRRRRNGRPSADALRRLVDGDRRRSGEVVAKQEYTFTFDADRVETLSASVGQRVEEGEVLVELDSTQQELALLQAERSLNDARAEGVPATIREKELSYEVARKNLEEATLRAPFPGVITQLTRPTTSNGNWSLTLIDTSELFIEAEADQLDAPNLAEGQSAQATIEPLPDRSWPVEIVEVGGMAVARGNSTVVVVTAKLPEADPSVRVGYTAEMTITTSQALDVLLVPITCVTQTPRGWSVTKIADGENVVQRVSIGATSDAYAEITEGLEEGDLVLLNSTTTRTSGGNDARTDRMMDFQFQGGQGTLPAGGFPGGAP